MFKIYRDEKILLYAVVLLTAIGCKKSSLEVDNNLPSENLVPITIQAALSGNSDSRIAVTPSDESVWKSSWEDDDCLTLLSTTGGASQKLAIKSIDQESGIATFTGEVLRGTYEVYTGVIDQVDGSIVYSEQFASDKCTKMPMKASDDLVVSADNEDFSNTLLYFNHLSQVMELCVSLSGVSSEYTLEYIEISGKDNQSDYGFDNVRVIFSQKSVSSTTEDFSVYCYLPSFTVPVNGSVNFSVQVSDNSGAPYTIRAAATNTTGSDVEFEIGKHNYLNVAFDFTNPTTDTWIDFAAATFAGDVAYADGVDSYTISTPEEFALLAKLVNEGVSDMTGKTFTLVNDIDLWGREWVAIGADTKPFKGTFDGANHTISNLYINQPTVNFQALFGFINGATIKNSSVSGSIVGSALVGGVVGGARNASTVINCYNLSEVKGAENVGGVVGITESSAVVNCYNLAAVNGAENVGGVVGCSQNTSSVTNCYNSAAVTGKNNVGGIAGYSQSNSTVTSCYYAKDIENTDGVTMSKGIGNIDTDVILNTKGMTTAQMQGAELLKSLNNGAYFYNLTLTAPATEACAWTTSGSYPVFDFEVEPVFNFLGEGSEVAPYQINSARDLRQLSVFVNTGVSTYKGNYFEMTCDIDLGGMGADGQTPTADKEFTAIGVDGAYHGGNINSATNIFRGVFDGGNHEVSGLYINKPESNSQGLFGYITGATIKNLTVSGSVTGKKYVGGITGRSYVGYGSTAVSIINCHNKVEVTGTETNDAYIGGVIGCANGTSSPKYSKVENCSNSGKITSVGSCTGGITGGAFKSAITNCSNNGIISSTETNVGGIAGRASGSVTTNCYNTAAVSSTLDRVGGIIGLNEGPIINCYNTANISANRDYVGGIAGGSDTSLVIGCYSTGRIRGVSGVGAIIGNGDSVISVTNCYYDKDVFTGKTAFGAGITAAEMKDAGFVANLNEVAYAYNYTSPDVRACVWTQPSDPAVNNGFPVLDFDAEPVYKQFDDVTGGVDFGKPAQR